jgi:hypothetical protein
MLGYTQEMLVTSNETKIERTRRGNNYDTPQTVDE